MDERDLSRHRLLNQLLNVAGENGRAAGFNEYGDGYLVESRVVYDQRNGPWLEPTWGDADPQEAWTSLIDRRVFWQQPLGRALEKLEHMPPEQARAMLGH